MRPRRVSQSAKRLGGAPVARFGRVPFHHHAVGDGVGGFIIVGVDADVADMREGEGDDLARIGRVGHDFLIAGHRGVEAQFRHGLAGGAKAHAVEQRAVGQCQTGGRVVGSARCRHVGCPHNSGICAKLRARAGRVKGQEKIGELLYINELGF